MANRNEPHQTRLPGDPLPTYEELLQRIEKLEASPITLKDLPITQLQTKLENDWQPNAGVLLTPASISETLLADASVSEAKLAAPTAWTTVTYGAPHGWRRLGGAAGFEVQVARFGKLCVMRGVADNTIAFTYPTLVCTLPVGFKPARNESTFVHMLNGTTGGGGSRMQITTTGTMTMDAGYGINGSIGSQVYFLGINFLTV